MYSSVHAHFGAAHSSTSVHVTPKSAVSYPALHAHVKEPSVSVQVACASQSCVPAAHSSTSGHSGAEEGP
eukprot:3407958-Rhodomonas_salina.1